MKRGVERVFWLTQQKDWFMLQIFLFWQFLICKCLLKVTSAKTQLSSDSGGLQNILTKKYPNFIGHSHRSDLVFALFPFLYLEDPQSTYLAILTHVLILPMVYGNYKMRDKHVFISWGRQETFKMSPSKCVRKMDLSSATYGSIQLKFFF